MSSGEPRALFGCGRRGQDSSCPTTKVAQVYPTSVGRSRQTRSQVQRLVEFRRRDGGLLTHVAKNRDLGSRGDQRIGHSIDPDSGAAPIPALLARDSLKGKDAVRTRELA